MKKKKLIILPILLISIVLLTGCFKVIDFDTIYDDDKAISKSYNSFNMTNPQTNIKDNIFYGTLTLSGMKEIWDYTTDIDEEIELTYILSTDKGDAKLALIDDDGIVTTLIDTVDLEESDNERTITFPVTKGQNRIKLVGRDAKINFSFEFDKGNLKKL